MFQNVPPPQLFSEQQRTAKVAVILPVYNTARYLRECLDSLLSQTYQNFTVFAVNDGSTDDSGKILEEYAKTDSRIHVINKENGGVSSARNIALDKIAEDRSFDLVCFSDSDDIVEEDFIRTFAEIYTQHHADYVVCCLKPFNTKGFINNHNIRNACQEIRIDQASAFNHLFQVGEWSENHPSCSYLLMNRCFTWNAISEERFNESLKTGEDLDFIIRSIVHINHGIVTNHENYRYRIRASSLCHSSNLTISDMFLFVGFLRMANLFPKDTQNELRKQAHDRWWLSVKQAAHTGTLDQEYNKLSEALRFIKAHAPLQKKISNLRRSFLFALGPTILKLYFHTKKTKVIEQHLDSPYE